MTPPIEPIPRAKSVAEGLPAAGSTVIFEGRIEAMVTRARADGSLDLVIYQDARPIAHASVPHDLQFGWCNPEEVPPIPPPPPTLEEELAAAEAMGRRVPRAGTEVVYLYDLVLGSTLNPNAPTQDVIGHRARVLRPITLESADLEIFVNDGPPLEPDEVDAVREEIVRRVRHDPSGTYPDRFAYPGEFTPVGPIAKAVARPRWYCERPGCSNPADPGVSVQVADAGGGRFCSACGSAAASFVRGGPLAGPAPDDGEG